LGGGGFCEIFRAAHMQALKALLAFFKEERDEINNGVGAFDGLLYGCFKAQIGLYQLHLPDITDNF